MKLHELARLGPDAVVPLSIELPDAADCLRLDSLSRTASATYVGSGQWCGQPVWARLLVGAQAAHRHRQELSGVRLLAEQRVNTPQLLAHGLAAGEGGWLLYEYLDNAQGSGDAWETVADQAPLSDAQQAVLADTLGAVAELHARGLWQTDPLNHLLRHRGRLYWVGGQSLGAQTPGQPLSRDRVLANLGGLFARLPASLQPFIEELLVCYLLANGEHALPLEALQHEIDKARRGRLQRLLKDVRRDCAAFSVQRSFAGLRAVVRREEPRLKAILDNPEAAMAGGEILKPGSGSTVVRVQTAAGPVVIKRYNAKGWSHWLRYALGPSRAVRSWVSGHRLEWLGLGTPRPLAVLEIRRCGVRFSSYLITESLDRNDLFAHLKPDLEGIPGQAELQALEDLFTTFLRERISHGDLKGSNLLWDGTRWLLLDLDAMRQHGSELCFRYAYAKDRARLLRNWPAGSEARRVVAARVPEGK